MPVLGEQEGRCLGILCAKPAPATSLVALQQPAVGDLLAAAALALGAAAHTLRMWEASAVRELLRAVHTDQVSAVGSSPDERRTRLRLYLLCAPPSLSLSLSSLPRLRMPHVKAESSDAFDASRTSRVGTGR